MRLRLDIFKQVEHVLYNYPKILELLADRELENGTYLGASGSHEQIGSRSQSVSDNTANAALREVDDERLNALQAIVSKVNAIFEDNPKWYQLYRTRYVEGIKHWDDIVKEVGKSERQCHIYRRQLVEEIAGEVSLRTLSVIYDLLQ